MRPHYNRALRPSPLSGHRIRRGGLPGEIACVLCRIGGDRGLTVSAVRASAGAAEAHQRAAAPPGAPLGAGRGVMSSELALRGDLPAQMLLPLPDLPGRVAGREILGLEDLTQLDFGAAVEGRALEPLDRLVLGLALPQPEPGDQLLGLRERPVGHGPLLPLEFDPRPLRGEEAD